MSIPVPRRTALALGAVGLGGAAVALASCDPEPLRDLTDDARDAVTGAAGTSWVEPVVLTSSAGVLELEVRVEEDSVAVAGSTARMLAYNGTVPGPTLHVRPGDTLQVRVVNALKDPTSIHLHGMQPSTAGASDDPFVEVAPGATYLYSFVLPLDHPQGVFWYRPQAYGTAAGQVFGGMYGAIVVDRHDWSVAAPRIVLVSDTTLDSGRIVTPTQTEREQGRVGTTVLTNGRVAPRIRLRPGATERWLVINACASRYLDLGLGGREVTVHALDAGALEGGWQTDRVVLPPGGRAHLEVVIPQAQVELIASAYSIGSMQRSRLRGRASVPEDAVVMAVVPDAEANLRQPAGPGEASSLDLRDRSVDQSRTIELSTQSGIGGRRFLLDGREFAADRVDQEVAFGAVEEWTLRNATPTDMPFHLHAWPMQVVSRAGEPVSRVEVRDVVDVPAGTDVVVRIRFDRVARSVYQCQILDHADAGMMGVVDVVRQSTS